MGKILASVVFTLSFFVPSLLYGLEFTCLNDCLGWGYVDEWDDFETYSFGISDNLNGFETGIDYKCYTLRESGENEACRIDSLALQTLFHMDLTPFDFFSVELCIGGKARLFGNWQGMLIQTDWHSVVMGIHREVPESYEDPFFMFSLPLQLEMADSFIEGLSLSAKTEISYPFQFEASAAAGYQLPSFILPLSLSAGYNWSIINETSLSYPASQNKQKGFFVSSNYDLWPVRLVRIFYMEQGWGNGGYVIMFSEPEGPADPSVESDLIFSGITHHTYGIRVEKKIAEDILFKGSSIGFIYRSQNGWLDTSMEDSEGGRFSSLMLGIQTGWKLPVGPVRFEFFSYAGGGFRQNNYYELTAAAAVPFYTEYLITGEAGGGVKFLVPFFHERMIGPGIEAAYEFGINLNGNRPPELPQYAPYHFNLFITVTGRE